MNVTAEITSRPFAVNPRTLKKRVRKLSLAAKLFRRTFRVCYPGRLTSKVLHKIPCGLLVSRGKFGWWPNLKNMWI